MKRALLSGLYLRTQAHLRTIPKPRSLASNAAVYGDDIAADRLLVLDGVVR